MSNNRPLQLERIRKEHYDKMYARQPVLMNKLKPFMKKAEKIQDSTEPSLSTSKDQLRAKVSKSEPLRVKKITDIRLDVLEGLK